jgi:hypothetical protein
MADTRLEFEFGDNAPEHRLAKLWRQRKDEIRLFKEIKTEHKARVEKIDNEIDRVSTAILSGQQEMFEPIPEQPKPTEAQEQA